MTRFRPLAFSLLVAALCVQALALGLASGRAEAFAGPRHEVVICGTDGPEVLTLDAQGRPVAPEDTCPQRLCPDCVAAAAFALTSAALPLAAPRPHTTTTPQPHRFKLIRHAPHTPPARAPPVRGLSE
ncbi:MAG: hypothetical protein CVT80_15135 [Alphaproteobacteria bacterium HGW-Alphaproteobacteria-2]|nr:MAG: hypothetical protein CVT80_15135 [Alphaproteobacteria bacterium HGW-Alphaproteobacteria-2]